MGNKGVEKAKKSIKKTSELSFDAVLGAIILVGFGFLLGFVTGVLI